MGKIKKPDCFGKDVDCDPTFCTFRKACEGEKA